MIIYDLRCDNDHQFEGWFRSATDFEAQANSHLVICPQCNSHNIRRVPSAVAIFGQGTPDAGGGASTAKYSSCGKAVMPAGTQVMATYRQLVSALIANSEDVGKSFAAEARKIHYQEAPSRAIHGDATANDLESLAEEGIAVMHLPNLEDKDLN